MTAVASHRPGPAHQALIGPAPGGSPADIIELLMADHRRIRRLSQVLDDAARWAGHPGPSWFPALAWNRLADLLDAHRLTIPQRRQLGRHWTTFTAAWTLDAGTRRRSV